jgi:hypothetical protein
LVALRVAKPDAALGFDLFEIGAAIGREEKRNQEDVPRTAGRLTVPKEKAPFLRSRFASITPTQVSPTKKA